MSLIQGAKLAVVAFTRLSKDALHVYLGLGTWLLAALLMRRSIASLRPWLAVLLFAASAKHSMPSTTGAI